MMVQVTTRDLLLTVRSRLRRDAVFFGVAATVLALDQLTKYLVRSRLELGESFPTDWPVRITHVSNSGAAFGILQNQGSFLALTSLLGLIAILLYYFYPPLEHGLLRLDLGLLLGGALGNLVDRLRMGEVTDFIDFRFWPAFNVADSSITIGIVVLIAFLLLNEGHLTSPKRE